MPSPVSRPTLATSPSALTAEVESAIEAICTHIDNSNSAIEASDGGVSDVKAAFVAWIDAIQDATLRATRASLANDLDAEAKNEALEEAYLALRAAIA